MRTIFLMAALAVSAILCVPAQAQEETRHEVGIFPFRLVVKTIFACFRPSVLRTAQQ